MLKDSNVSNKPAANVEAANKYFLRPDEAAQFLGISKRSLSNLQRRHRIAYSKLNRICLFKVSDLIAAVERGRINAVGE